MHNKPTMVYKKHKIKYVWFIKKLKILKKFSYLEKNFEKK